MMVSLNHYLFRRLFTSVAVHVVNQHLLRSAKFAAGCIASDKGLGFELWLQPSVGLNFNLSILHLFYCMSGFYFLHTLLYDICEPQ